MTPRPSFASKRRPLSAIFLGAGPVPSPSDLPDLPEPPSPGASSTHSGLPSPPATNSTGSSSAGDSREVLDRPFHRPTSTLAMRNEKPLNSRSSRASSPAGGTESRKGEDDEEEDNTARLNLSRRRGTSQSTDHVMTLQRVMSLTQRNRMALNKLSSMRLNTPSPPQPSHSSRSPNPPSALASSASTSTRSRSAEPAALSGSETEREPGAHLFKFIRRPICYTTSWMVDSDALRSPLLLPREKLPYQPAASPPDRHKGHPRSESLLCLCPTPKYMNTIPMTSPPPLWRRWPRYGGAREAVERKIGNLSPGNSSNLDGVAPDGRTSKEPTTPQKLRYSALVSDTSPSRTSARRTLQNPNSSQRSSQANQVSVVRKHQTRWMSEDLRTSSARSIVDDNEDDDLRGSSNDVGNRQTVRGGSVETSLGTRLVGGSLRAAGMSVKTGTDVFREPEESSMKARGPISIRTGSIQEQKSAAGSSRESGPSRAAILHDLHTPANAPSQYLLERGAHSGPRSRPSTSMADFLPFNEDLHPPKTAPPGLRTYRSAYALDRDREGIGSRQGSSTPFSTVSQERTYGSPRTRPREFPVQPLDEQAVEHLRLMDESLTMFEAVLSRLPPMGDTTTATVPEVFRNAQAVATNRALERLVDSEVSDASVAGEVDLVGLWKDVGGDCRDMLRVSDELVRTMTGFMLGVGKVLRESANVGASAGAGSSLQHLRGASEDLSRRSGADGRSSTSAGTGTGSGRGSGSGDGFSGRRSTESRRSWDPARVERDKGDLLRRGSSRVDVGALSGQRASSSMLLREREPPARERAAEDGSPAAARPVTSTRRLYTPGFQRESTPASAKPDLVTIESQRSLHIEDDYEPSPTPAPRPRQSLDESVRKLPQLAIPSPLPTLPSESRAAAEQQAQADKSTSTTRRKTSAASTVTMRGNVGNPGLTITTPSAAPTTAVTTLPVSRTDSGQSSASASSSTGASSSRHAHSNTVTFSRPLTVSIGALSGLQRHRPSSSEAPPLSAGPTPITPAERRRFVTMDAALGL
ncbi:hypothetical protein EDB92DRAFT_2105965 [Lactarius akahatsu]|uniref:Uncharacterized protein n=1 Tax=Lactarius akahatsu TaxID=416441 RepID=A0AAD4L9D3_9AGAM|nr:hypothetical protein EDB92DRAFT_2105965 [Lactarius akahatsu]